MKYFKFFTADFLIGTHHFTDAEVGVYIRMLCHQWDKGQLPATDAELKSIFGAGITAKVMDKFTRTDSGFKNERLDKERCLAITKTMKMSKNGKKGASAKWSGGMVMTPPPPSGTPAPDFYVGIHGFNQTPADWLKENGQSYIEAQMMKHSLGSASESVLTRTLELLNSNYTGYQFKDSNHVKNSFRTCLEKILSEKPNTKLSIDGSDSF